MEWQSIDTHVGGYNAGPALFWLVAKPPHEQPRFEASDEPMIHTLHPAQQLFKGRYGTWSCLCKATHWMPLPAPILRRAS